MIENSFLPAIIVSIPLFSALAILLIAQTNLKAKEWLSFLGSLFPLILILFLLPKVLKNTFLSCFLIHITPDIQLQFKVDQIGFIFAATAAFLWSMASLYSWGYMKGEEHLTRFYAFLLLNLCWTLGVAFAANLLTLYIFYELLSISSYPIIAHEETPEALAAALKYLIYVIIGGVFIFLGLVFTYFLSHNLAFTQNGILALSMGKTLLITIFTIFIIGFGVKAAIMPLHGWVPDAHPAAPAPASALLSGILVAAGSFGIIRIFYNIFGISLTKKLGLNLPLAYLACVTIIFSSILAITQNNLKRRLAYSTIGQMSYVLLGISLLGSYGFIGGVVHIANHAFMKGTLFLCAGVLIKAANKRNITEMNGIGYEFPLTMGAFALASLGLIGIPPLAGFVSKLFLGLGTLEASEPIFLIVLLLGSLLCACYLLPVVYVAFFKKSEEEMILSKKEGERKFELETKKISWSMSIPIIFGALEVVILGILGALKYLPVSLIMVAAKNFFGGLL